MELLRRYSKLSGLPELPHIIQFNTTSADSGRVHAARRRLSAAVVRQLAAEYQAGVRSTQLAKRYGISKGAVLRLLREQGIRIRRQSMTPAEIKQAIQLYAVGKSLAGVGAALGYDHGTIHRALKQAGVVMRDSHGRTR